MKRVMITAKWQQGWGVKAGAHNDSDLILLLTKMRF